VKVKNFKEERLYLLTSSIGVPFGNGLYRVCNSVTGKPPVEVTPFVDVGLKIFELFCVPVSDSSMGVFVR
jgi:hypothetical protein